MTAPDPACAPATVVVGHRSLHEGLQRITSADGLVGYRSALLASCGVPHFFTTRVFTSRRGGLAAPELDLGRLAAGQHESITRAAGLGGAQIVAVQQVHGAGVLRLTAEALPALRAEADALVSERDDVLVCVHVADCVPILLTRADGRHVAAVHAGWRGLVAGVIPRAIEALGPGRTIAAIGPCLSCERFEVGPEVVAAFERVGLAAAVHPRPRERARIDLRAAALVQLVAAGVEAIEISDRCTYTHAEEFYSYRRDVTHGGGARTGRLGALIAAR